MSRILLLKSLGRRWRARFSAFTAGNYLLSLFYIAIILIPIYYLFVSSFKENAEVYSDPLGWPITMDLRKYIGAEKNAELFTATGWSLFVTVGTEVLLVLVAFPAAYALARIPSPLTGLVEAVFGAGFLVPVFALLLPTFLLVAKLGLLFKPTALIFVYPGGLMPFAVLFLANYLRTIPRELEESALVDGANRFQVMTRIMFPLAMPGIVTVLVLMFITVWNEYVFAFVMSGRDFRTVQIALTELKALRRFDVGEASAGVLMSIAPVYLMFIFFQERIISGLTRGALKG